MAGLRQQSGGSLNVAAMRRRPQPLYEAHGLGPVPEPTGRASGVTAERRAMLLDGNWIW